MLNKFFGEGDDQVAVLKAIKKCETDKFKPLRNFLKKETESTDDKNIELLAWLIDFKERPYDYSKNYNVDNLEPIPVQVEEHIGDGENEAISSDGAGPEGEQPKTTDTEFVQIGFGAAEDPVVPTKPEPAASGGAGKNDKEKETQAIAEGPDQSEAPAGVAGTTAEPADPVGGENVEELLMGMVKPMQEVRRPVSVFKRGLAVLAITLLAVAGFWFYRGGKKEPEPIPMGQGLPANNACMYWTGDHYEQIPCRGTTGDTLVEPLDPEKIRSFKKITRPDTITRQSKGSVWYVKINKGKDIEFYTSDGFHPIDRQLRLKPVTDYIIEKHIQPAQAQNAGN
ncbi:hypothetical protein LL912_15775 [Niabella sp. CC-SYL272]|uniref:hypothetical protein n=1 Tax=Niabella agricola TaxID=2891571 RepID=UPI001F255BC1|nr:hypothetical protein [Niabella agricola]MCF3110243.1 hypothetical protein [Niabella agricola]